MKSTIFQSSNVYGSVRTLKRFILIQYSRIDGNLVLNSQFRIIISISRRDLVGHITIKLWSEITINSIGVRRKEIYLSLKSHL